jgi:hypothetical protein
MSDDWRAAIAEYDANVASGVIAFGNGEFASEFPGRAEQDQQISTWLESHIPTDI